MTLLLPTHRGGRCLGSATYLFPLRCNTFTEAAEKHNREWLKNYEFSESD
ncbi:hypothetical protein GCM10009754_88220 [Amycolatopsis minnesotensis]|uniref:Uncharacterized protein n=1 Tax=Amycolatopsis minnesotensis TaxID=337894 RepID=A0ABN2SZH8_9PSEU